MHFLFTNCPVLIHHPDLLSFILIYLTALQHLREKRREIRAADLVKLDDEVTVKLENAAIERSKSVDSAVLGKYSIWRKENENENPDSTVRLIRDQMIMARVYISLSRIKHKTDLANELQNQLKESQRALGEATADSDLHTRYWIMMILYVCKTISKRLSIYKEHILQFRERL